MSKLNTNYVCGVMWNLHLRFFFEPLISIIMLYLHRGLLRIFLLVYWIIDI